jgi:hypothetical protein
VKIAMPRAGRTLIPRPVKIAYSVFVAVLVPVYWAEYGPANFLWACDIALLVTLVALWRESRLLASAMAVAILAPEAAWNLDFFLRLAAGRDVFGLGATDYMFDRSRPLWLRELSLFHAFLPLLLGSMVRRLGYDSRAFAAATALCWIVLLASYAFTDPSLNINWVFGGGSLSMAWLSGPWYVAGLMLAFPLLVYLPTHLLLRRLWGRR